MYRNAFESNADTLYIEKLCKWYQITTSGLLKERENVYIKKNLDLSFVFKSTRTSSTRALLDTLTIQLLDKLVKCTPQCISKLINQWMYAFYLKNRMGD